MSTIDRHLSATTLRVALVLVLMLAGTYSAWAQSGRLLPEGDNAYTYIERLQRRGHLLDLNPTRLPYAEADVARALARLDTTALRPLERRWAEHIGTRLHPTLADTASEATYRAELGGGIVMSNSRRLDTVRPFGETTEAYPYGIGQVVLGRGGWVASLGIRHDGYYDRDPDGLDAVTRLMARSEDSYVGYRSRYVNAYLGRFASHWGRVEETALVISANPRPYDAIHLRLGGDRLSLTSLLGELDSMTADGRFTGTAGADSVAGQENRYLVAHRIDWRPTRGFQLSFMESVVYSGAEAGLSLNYLIPTTPLFIAVDNRPKNVENNGLVGGLLWLHRGSLTLHGQLLLDDFDFINGAEPASFALTGALIVAGVTPWADVGLTLDAIAGRTYNAQQLEGQYHYLQRGLATQFSDYVHARLFADLYLDTLVPGLMVTPTVHLLAQGEGDLRQAYPDNSEAMILEGTVERTVRLAADIRYQADPRWWLRVDAGINAIRNRGNVDGVQETRGVVQVAFGFRLAHTGRLNLDMP